MWCWLGSAAVEDTHVAVFGHYAAWHQAANALDPLRILSAVSCPVCSPYKKKCFWADDRPKRLSEIRNERRPGNKYASFESCRAEVNQAESMMRREGYCLAVINTSPLRKSPRPFCATSARID